MKFINWLTERLVNFEEGVPSMFESKWLYEIMLVIYSLRIMGYFFDFIKKNWKVNRISFSLLCIVWAMQTAILYNQTFIIKSFPILSLNEGLFFYAWILLTFSLIINLFPIHFIVLFVNVFSFFILILSITINAQHLSYEIGAEFVHEILVTHITLAIVSYGFFTISFILAVLYLLQYQLLKSKKGLKWLWRFTELRKLDTYSYGAIIMGVPLLLIGLILGIVWAHVSGDPFYWFDLKTLGSIFLFVVYSVYFLVRLVFGYSGKPISIYNTAAFLFLLVNLLLFSQLSNFHF